MSNLEEEIMIPPVTKRLRHDDDAENENENEDRLSDLHDGVLLHILSFLNSKHAVRTCVLSTRWKHIWKHIPTLILHSSDFSTLKIFTKFVSRILSFRDDSFSLHELDFSRRGSMELPLLKRIMKYVISHNIQRLALCLNCEIERISSFIFSCRTLTHLKLSIYVKGSGRTSFPKYLNLPALTSLYLYNFAFCADNDVADPFLTLNKLNHLVLSDCDVRDAITLRISSSMLVRLSICCHDPATLKIIELCTPSLGTFVFTGVPHMTLKGSNISSIEHVDVDAYLISMCVDPAFNLLSWLIDFIGIKSLVLTVSTLQVLFFIPGLLKGRFPFLKNLKSLKVLDQELSRALCSFLRLAKLQKAKSVSLQEACKQLNMENKKMEGTFTQSLPLPDGIVDFLLQNSPYAEVDILNFSK